MSTISIIGAGNMGTALATRFSKAGFTINIAAKTSDKAQKVAEQIPNVQAVELSALANADVIIVATPFANAVEALREVGNIAGKVIIDITNPLTADMTGLSIGHTTSAGEEIQKAFPEAEVVKAFNTIFAQVFATERKPQVFYAGNDQEAKNKVHSLIEKIGFEAIDSGNLSNARLLEPLGMLNIYLGYFAQRGVGIAPAWNNY